jgi:hypothetical protein
MGILSDFVVADRSEAESVAATLDRSRWPLLRSKGFTPLEVGLLHFALTGEDASAPVSPPKFAKNPFTGKETPLSVSIAYLDNFPCLHDGGEAWVYEVPASLVCELANASGVDAVAANWAAFEELERADPEDLKAVIIELGRLAGLAREQRKSLLLWISL